VNIISVAQLAKCILLHTYSRSTAATSCASTKNSCSFFNELAIMILLVIN